ncbi:cell division protein FtsX [Chachezhania sediminis]|uniref:cell division protein FtsX n=1 Tax=Chachezhania sediminis TaxID=2599291 RepID=UPI00131C8DBD|nr:cell division protein FtsX [Chachezhania sediminis]
MSRGLMLRTLIFGDDQANRIVPPSGYTARLTIFAAGAMAFLAVFALSLSLAAGRVSHRWSQELAQAATLRISAPADQMADLTAKALQVLSQTPGVARARALSAEEQSALLAPWFGNELPVENLSLPQLVEVIEDDPGYDATGLRLRLEAEVPGAVLDDHDRWRRPLVAAARALKLLGWVSILLIGGAMATMITLAANAALSANAQIISVLRLVGAQDRYIASAFVRRFTLRALAGAAAGTVLGMVGVMLLPSASAEGSILTGLGFHGGGWILPLLIPVLAALVALGATTQAARTRLRSLP